MKDPYGLIDDLAAGVMDDHQKARPEVFASYKGDANDPWLEETKKQLTFLFDAAVMDSPQLFINYISWAKVVLKHTGAPSDLLYEKLQHMRERCRSELEGPFAAKVDHILQSTLERFPTMPESAPRYIDENEEMGKVALTYLENVLQGDRSKAEETIRQALARGLPFKDLYLNVFQRTQYELGRRWQEGLISVAQEHLVTEVTLQLMAQLYAEMCPRKVGKGSIVVTCVGNEMHEVGARMVADFLEVDGWAVSFLGANTPHPDVVSITKQRQAKFLLVSATMAYNVRRVRGLIRFVRGDPELGDIKIVVGGYPFNNVEGLWKAIGADGFASDALEAVQVVNDLAK
ncbi:MAG: cobalamin-dependent protein [Methanomassiliicoccus sp.]|nr:cobalamin-dependent protein [Methanomassiliicoccus sp.]